jgi:FlaA1/EpsC-like NDP-sugar epimerase
LEGLRPILYTLSLSSYLNVLFLVAPIIILLLALAGLYNLKGTRRISAELLKILLAISSALLLVVIVFFFDQQAFPSRLIVLLTWGLAIVGISLGRIILRLFQVQMLRRGIGLHRLAVINPGQAELISTIENRPELGYKIVGQLNSSLAIDDLIAQLQVIRKERGLDELYRLILFWIRKLAGKYCNSAATTGSDLTLSQIYLKHQPRILPWKLFPVFPSSRLRELRLRVGAGSSNEF